MKTTKLVLALLGGAFCLKMTVAVLAAVNSIPFIGDVFELVGLVMVIKFAVANLTITKREETVEKIKTNLDEIGLIEEEDIKELSDVVHKAQEFVEGFVKGNSEANSTLEVVTQEDKMSIPEYREALVLLENNYYSEDSQITVKEKYGKEVLQYLMYSL